MSLIRNIKCFVMWYFAQLKNVPVIRMQLAEQPTHGWVCCSTGSKILIMINILIISQVYSFEQQNIFVSSHIHMNKGRPANSCTRGSNQKLKYKQPNSEWINFMLKVGVSPTLLQDVQEGCGQSCAADVSSAVYYVDDPEDTDVRWFVQPCWTQPRSVKYLKQLEMFPQCEECSTELDYGWSLHITANQVHSESTKNYSVCLILEALSDDLN